MEKEKMMQRKKMGGYSTIMRINSRKKRALFRAALFIIGAIFILIGIGCDFLGTDPDIGTNSIIAILGICLMFVTLFRHYLLKQKEMMDKKWLE